MLETYVDHDIILEKVQRQMDNIAISNQGASTSRNVENQRTRNVENRGFGGGILQGVIPNVRHDPTITQETKQIIEIAQMNQTIREMQNELTRLRRGEFFSSNDQNPRVLAHEQRRNHLQ
jgi:hypothetical protein